MPVLSCFLVVERRGSSRATTAERTHSDAHKTHLRMSCARPGTSERTAGDGPTSPTDPWLVKHAQAAVSLASKLHRDPQRVNAAPWPLHKRARTTEAPEPILIPKLRIYFADFPYLHYSKQLEAAHLGDLMRLLVRSILKIWKKNHLSPWFSRTIENALGTSKKWYTLPVKIPYLYITYFYGI